MPGCLQDVTGDARSRVSSYNWTGSTAPLLQALLLDISRYNDTAWDTYSRLDRTLEHMAGSFWSTLSASVNALPNTNQFRLLQVLISPDRYFSALEQVKGPYPTGA